MARVAGILMPITSLSSPYGIGTIGKEARKNGKHSTEISKQMS